MTSNNCAKRGLSVLIGGFLMAIAVTGSAQDAMFVDSSGDVGVGTNTPASAVHILRSDDSSQVLVEDSASAASQIMFKLKDAGAPRFNMENTADGYQWNFNAFKSGFTIGLAGTGGSELVVGDNGSLTVGPGGNANFQVDAEGNVFVEGSMVHSSSRDTKKAISPIDPEAVLAKVGRLKLAEWSYADSANGDRHLSPMAEDFYAAFGLGPDNKHVSPSDLAGVALASVKALQSKLRAKDARIDHLEQRLKALEDQMSD